MATVTPSRHVALQLVSFICACLYVSLYDVILGPPKTVMTRQLESRQSGSTTMPQPTEGAEGVESDSEPTPEEAQNESVPTEPKPLIPPYSLHSDNKKIIDHEPSAAPARIPTPRAEYTNFTGDPAEVAARERRRKLLELAKAKFPDGNVPMPYIPSAAPARIPTPRAEYTQFTGDPAEVAARERRRKLLELANAASPGGNVPTPYLLVPARHLQDDRLPFVRASLAIAQDDGDGTVRDIFDDVWCLWDTGAYCTMIPSHYLHHEVTGGHERGFASLEITFAGTRKKIETTIAFQPDIPNQADFIILGQQSLIACIRYEVTPATHNPNNTDELAYGVLDLKSYYDPVERSVSPFDV